MANNLKALLFFFRLLTTVTSAVLRTYPIRASSYHAPHKLLKCMFLTPKALQNKGEQTDKVLFNENIRGCDYALGIACINPAQFQCKQKSFSLDSMMRTSNNSSEINIAADFCNRFYCKSNHYLIMV